VLTRSAYITVVRVITYRYDGLYRLVEADYSGGENFQYAYDAVGNRTAYTATITQTTVTTYTYDAANRLVNTGGVPYTWDNRGNLLADGVYTYTWDAAGRLITVTDGVNTLGFRYDGDGNRLARIVNGTLTTHTLNVGLPLPEVLVEHDDGGTTRYLHLPHSIATDAGTAWTYSAVDGLGSVRQQLDDSGQVVSVDSYRPFGSPLEGDGGAPYGYTGEWWEVEAGLLFLRARYLQPRTGRFISRDLWPGSALQPQTFNGYTWVEGNPINRKDPSGLLSKQVIAESFEMDRFDEVLQLFRTTGRWGFLKALLDAQMGNRISIGVEGEAPEWARFRLKCTGGKLALEPEAPGLGTSPIMPQTLAEFEQHFLENPWTIATYNDYAGRPPWRQAKRWNWYFVNERGGYAGIMGYPDQYWESTSPDFKSVGGGMGAEIGLGVTAGGSSQGIVDRYGHRYIALSVSGGLGVALELPFNLGYFEGYASTIGAPMDRRHIPSEEELRGIIESSGPLNLIPSPGYEMVAGVGAGLASSWSWGHGAMIFSFQTQIGVSAGLMWVWHTGRDMTEAWYLVDRMRPGYGEENVWWETQRDDSPDTCNECSPGVYPFP